MRIAIVPVTLQSHFNFVFGLIGELQRRGHELLVIAPQLHLFPYVRDALAELEVRAETIQTNWDPVPASNEVMAKRCYDHGEQERAYKSWFDYMPTLLPEMRERLSAFGPEVMVVDSMFLPAAAAAAALRVPYAASYCTSLLAVDGISSVRHLVNPHGQAALDKMFEGIAGPVPTVRYLDVISPYANLVWQARSFSGDVDPRADLVGPTMRRPKFTSTDISFESLRERGRPIAYVGFGSFANHYLDLYKRLMAACEALSLTTIVSCPDYIYEQIATDNTTQTTAQLQALAVADVSIGGIGAVSLMESLWFGVPMMSLPHAGDQPLNAHLIERARVGIALPHDAPAAAIQDGLSRLITDGRFRARAREISADYRTHDGASNAADVVERIART